MPKCDFTSAYLFSCKFAARFHNTFSLEYLWTAACDLNDILTRIHKKTQGKLVPFSLFFS